MPILDKSESSLETPMSIDAFYSSDNTSVDIKHASEFVGIPSSPAKTKKARRVKFLCNGDKFYKGTIIAITSERYRSFDSLLTELTRALSKNNNLPSGVRTLFTLEGKKINSVDELEDGKVYICSGPGENFKKIDYLGQYPTIGRIKPARSSSRLSSLTNSAIIQKEVNEVVKPRIIVLIRNGNRPRKVMRLLLNKRNAPSFEHALSTITDAVKLDTGAVRKIFNASGTQVTNLEGFFQGDDTFLAFGSERTNPDDLEVDLEELKAVNAQRKSLPKSGGELKSGTHCFDETGKGVPLLPNKTKANKPNKRQDSSVVLPGKFGNKYALGPVIGDGNFAVVRRCVDKSKNVEYALKIIDKSKCAGKEYMIENEVSVLREVQHPNIIQLIAEHDTLSELYLVMELVKGGDLFDAISKAVKFTEADSRIMTQNLASALAYLHEKNIVHRDIKPENLLVEMQGTKVQTLKVADFGLAQKVTEPLFAVCGTPTYVAPEILTETGYSLEIDVWAMGVILYILLCGFPPFVSPNNDQDELFDDILSGKYSFPSPYWDDVSDVAKDLISRMLESNPELRFSAEDVLDHPWFEMV